MNNQSGDTKNWIFLGDSLTEGVGSLRLNYVTERIHLIELPPVDPKMFPHSRPAFLEINANLQKFAMLEGLDFTACFKEFEQRTDIRDLFYRDGFHPSRAGAQLLAHLLYSHIEQGVLS